MYSSMSEKKSISSRSSRDLGNLNEFKIEYGNSKIKVYCDKDLKNEALLELEKNYMLLENYIIEDKFFLTSYSPLNISKNAPRIVKIMADVAERVNVGPMASVAGTIAELICEFMLKNGANNVIVDNGGDICLRVSNPVTVRIYAGNSRFSNRIALKIMPESGKIGVCTSSSSVGHSVNFGDADAVTVVAKSCALADASATAIANCVRGKNGIERGIQKAKEIKGIDGTIIIRGDEMACFGNLPELVTK